MEVQLPTYPLSMGHGFPQREEGKCSQQQDDTDTTVQFSEDHLQRNF
jgi:hypothetical protein